MKKFQLLKWTAEVSEKELQHLESVDVHEVSRPFIGDFTARHKDNSLYIESIAGTFARIIVCISHLGIAGE